LSTWDDVSNNELSAFADPTATDTSVKLCMISHVGFYDSDTSMTYELWKEYKSSNGNTLALVLCPEQTTK